MLRRSARRIRGLMLSRPAGRSRKAMMGLGCWKTSSHERADKSQPKRHGGRFGLFGSRRRCPEVLFHHTKDDHLRTKNATMKAILGRLDHDHEFEAADVMIDGTSIEEHAFVFISGTQSRQDKSSLCAPSKASYSSYHLSYTLWPTHGTGHARAHPSWYSLERVHRSDPSLVSAKQGPFGP